MFLPSIAVHYARDTKRTTPPYSAVGGTSLKMGLSILTVTANSNMYVSGYRSSGDPPAYPRSFRILFELCDSFLESFTEVTFSG